MSGCGVPSPDPQTVSYTHLDVYKRQLGACGSLSSSVEAATPSVRIRFCDWIPIGVGNLGTLQAESDPAESGSLGAAFAYESRARCV